MVTTFRRAIAALAITTIWLFFKALPAGPISLPIPEPPLPVSLFGNIGADIFPSSDCLLALFFPLFVVGIKKLLVDNNEKNTAGWDWNPQYCDLDINFGVASLFGVVFVLVAVFIKWLLTFILDGHNAEVIGFVIIPVAIVVIYLISENKKVEIIKGVKVRLIPVRVSITEVVGFIVGFYSVMFFVSAAFRGWSFPWVLAAVWSFQELVSPWLLKSFGIAFAGSRHSGETKPPLKMA